MVAERHQAALGVGWLVSQVANRLMCLSCHGFACAGEFTEENALPRALQLVEQAGGIAAARQLAEREGQLARDALRGLTDSDAKRSLELMVDYVLERIH